MALCRVTGVHCAIEAGFEKADTLTGLGAAEPNCLLGGGRIGAYVLLGGSYAGAGAGVDDV